MNGLFQHQKTGKHHDQEVCPLPAYERADQQAPSFTQSFNLGQIEFIFDKGLQDIMRIYWYYINALHF